MEIPNDIQAWLKKPVAVLGAGVSGKAVVDLVDLLGGTSCVFDEQNSDFPDSFTLAQASEHELVIVSPGFALDHPWLLAAEEAGCEIMGELDLACMLWQGRVLAITGTNGKTTLVEFITHSLNFAGHEAYAVGNIGYPFAKLLTKTNNRDAWAVVEVSSFQAELMKRFRADTVVWSNFSEDHLDRYGDMESYFLAKAKLLKVADAKSVFIGKEVLSAYCDFGHSLPRDTYVVDSPFIRVPKHSIFNLKPQRENFRLAAVLFRSWGYDPEMLHDSVRSFRQSPHRLAPVSEINGIEFWNDSKATNFSSAEAALKHFHQPVYWIGGGRHKGGRIDAFAQRIGHRIKKAFLSGETAEEVAKVFQGLGVPCDTFDSLENSIKGAYSEASSGGVVLFSPGFASQKPFRHYKERGKCFEKVVSELKVNLQLTL